jgi:Protein of unknown function (DUF3617)
MTTLYSCRLAAAMVLVLGLIPMLADPPVAVAQEPGDLWQVTSQMSMTGMSMPAQTIQVCAAKEWTRPPGGDRPECENSNFASNGNTFTWDVTCTGAYPMTGHGEITRQGDDAYTGAINFMSSEMSMTIQLEGHRISDCPNPQ